MIKKTKHYSFSTGKIAEGCKQCVKGRKSVLFATGLCPRKCFYCPISDKKKDKDVVFINELQINPLHLDKLLEEIKTNQSTGVGITGGDPLSRLARTKGFIKVLKDQFGNSFHVHLYTSFDLVTENTLKQLFNAGLDEIRFHPNLEDSSNWKNIDNATKFKWKIGIEVPVFPDKEKELLNMIYSFKDKVNFFNFNELEMSDLNMEVMKEKYESDSDNSYAIKGSKKLGLKLMDFCDKHQLNAHFCTLKLKDKVQLAKRIKLRSKKAKLNTDKVTIEGLLVRGVIYSGMIPGVKYEDKLLDASKSFVNEELSELRKLKAKIVKLYNISKKKIKIDDSKLRLLTSQRIAKKLAKLIPEQCAIVTEYPTADQLAIEIEFIKP